jgi:DNA-binding transcriptional LysR family regulator
MISLYKLEVFNMVVQAGSFSAAAERLFLSQPAVSQHVQALESSLGVQLFERGPRGVRLTASGEILYDYTRCILSLLSEAESAVTNVSQLNSGQIRIGATPGVGSYVLPGWIQAFRMRYPKLTVSLLTDVTARVVAALLNHTLDAGFIEGELTDVPELEQVVLQTVSQWVVVSPDHAWAARDAVSLNALRGEPFVMRTPESQTSLWLLQTLKNFDVVPHIVAEFDNPEAIKQAVIAGMGISILPEYVFQHEREAGRLHALALQDVPLQRDLKLVWNARYPLTPVARAFLTGQFPYLLPKLQGLDDDGGPTTLNKCQSEPF